MRQDCLFIVTVSSLCSCSCARGFLADSFRDFFLTALESASKCARLTHCRSFLPCDSSALYRQEGFNQELGENVRHRHVQKTLIIIHRKSSGSSRLLLGI